MKKKIIALVITGSFLLGGTMTYAATNYYGDLLANQQDQISDEIKTNYNTLNQTIGEQQHRDLVMYVETKRQDILNEVNAYAESKVRNDAKERREEHTKAIDQEAERIIKELKEFVDGLD